MMLGALLTLAGLSSVSLATTLNTVRSPIDSSASQQPVVGATYDGSCFYPKPDPAFDLEQYLGRWYQVAGTLVFFTAGCKCIHADYSLNSNGTVHVKNACEATGLPASIQGTATPLDPNAGYGRKGVLQVQFPGTPPPDCPGPNYIVQDIGGKFPASRYYGAPSFAIVQASNFTTLFLLSREQKPSNASITAWLERARELGSDLSNVALTNQTGCKQT